MHYIFLQYFDTFYYNYNILLITLKYLIPKQPEVKPSTGY